MSDVVGEGKVFTEDDYKMVDRRRVRYGGSCCLLSNYLQSLDRPIWTVIRRYREVCYNTISYFLAKLAGFDED